LSLVLVVLHVGLRGRVALRLLHIPEVVAGLLVRRVGVEGREVRLRVEVEVRDRDLYAFFFVRLHDDVRHLPRHLVGDDLQDPTSLRAVLHARLEPDEPLLFHASKPPHYYPGWPKHLFTPPRWMLPPCLDLPPKSNKI